MIKQLLRVNVLFLLGILLLAALLRFYQLSTNPPSLTWDEVAWGYNAYALGIDGRDEFGRFLPYDYLESFGDFKPPMYAYLDIIPVKLWGMTESAVRFPSAFFGLLTVLITYLLVKEIFRRNLQNKSSRYAESIALLSALLLAISPWHILLSRAAFEANVASFFLITGVWLFLKGMQNRPLYFILSVIPFVASIYTFNTTRIVTPLIILLLAVGFWRKLINLKKEVIIAVILGLVLVAPTTPFLFSEQAKLRFKEVNIFSDLQPLETANQSIANDQSSPVSKLIHNRRLVYGVEYLQHYFDHLSFKFLFISGDENSKFSIHDVAQMYLWELPFLLAGILFLLRKHEGKWWLVPLWLLLAIVPAATARETPHALRIETALPTFQILVAYGIVSVYLLLKKYRKIFISLVFIAACINLVYYLHNYYVHYPKRTSTEWQYGYKEAITYAQQVEKEYDSILLTTKLGRPYAYVIFYAKMNPSDFRKQAVVERDIFGFVKIDKVGKYSFTDDGRKNKKTGNILYIFESDKIPEKVKVLKDFKNPNQEIILKAYTL